MDFLKQLQEKEKLKKAAADTMKEDGKDEDGSSKQSRSSRKESKTDSEYFHAWIYVDLSHVADGEGRSFFVESTTGLRKSLSDPSYRRINSVWNHENYWLSKTGQDAATTTGK